MVITLDFNTLAGEVRRSLSIIGKRSVDDKGTPMYNDITLGSLEEPLLADYFRQAVIDITTEADTFVSAATDTSVTLTFPSDHNTALDPAITNACKAYCISYALGSWFGITAPRLEEKYMKDCRRQIRALITLVHNKKAPEEAASSPLDIGSEVVERNTDNNDNSD